MGYLILEAIDKMIDDKPKQGIIEDFKDFIANNSNLARLGSIAVGIATGYAIGGFEFALPAALAGGITGVFLNHKFKKKFENFDRETAAATYKMLSDKKTRNKIDQAWMEHYENRRAINKADLTTGYASIGMWLFALLGYVTFGGGFLVAIPSVVIGYLSGAVFGNKILDYVDYGVIDKENKKNQIK